MLARLVRASARRAALTPTSAPLLAARAVSPWLTTRRGLCAGGAPMEVPIPEMGAESIVEGSILSIAKQVGDYVAEEEMVAEIETDKVTVEAKSPAAGTITAIHVSVDDTVEVGKPFFALAVGVGEAPTAAPAASAPAAAADAAPAAAAAPPPPPPPHQKLRRRHHQPTRTAVLRASTA